MLHKKFDCGCTFEASPHINLDISPDTINLFCPKTWDILGKGLTTGIFQLEKPLGKQWSKKLRPESIEHLSALTAILRPGCLEAVDEEGVSVTKKYCEVKNGKMVGESLDPSLDEVTVETYFQLIYQEQLMAMSRKLAGFSLQEADDLRKGVGKKDPELIAKIRTKFVDKATKLGIVTHEKAMRIFDDVEKSARYLFNKSHSVGYGFVSYQTAYIKAHFPHLFFTAWLRFSSNKQDKMEEVARLVMDARTFDIEVLPPCFYKSGITFQVEEKDGKKCIRYGLNHIKNFKEKSYQKIEALRDRQESFWKFLQYSGGALTRSALVPLIQSGCFDCYGEMRSRMIFWVETLDEFTKSEQKQMFEANADTIVGAAEAIIPTEKREMNVKGLVSILKSPPISLEDTPNQIVDWERELLGIPLTYNQFGGLVSCKDVLRGLTGKFVLSVRVDTIRPVLCKKGKAKGREMAFASMTDETGMVDVVIFPNTWDAVKQFIAINEQYDVSVSVRDDSVFLDGLV